MTLIKNILIVIIGLSAGGVISGGVFAFITMIGIIPRLAFRTGMAKSIVYLEDAVMWGGILGNIFSIFSPRFPVGMIGLIVFGFFAGNFIGCLALALAEVLSVIPVFIRRIKLTQGMPLILLAIAIGKALGSFYQLYLR